MEPVSLGLGRHPAPGDRIGAYVIQRLLGAGGMASVYLAVESSGDDDEATAPSDTRVALKVLNPARVAPEEVKRFTREYRALARMDHTNVVHVYEAGVHQGYPWIAMEFVDGTDLETEIERWRASPPVDRWERVEKILRGLCHGLQYIHDLGMIHRDLKPSNILLTSSGEPKVSDFGVVKGGGNTHSTQLTMAGRLVGTVAYMAPELITSEIVDRRVDLYGLGAILYVMLTMRRPIEAESVAGYLARHLTEIPKPPAEVDPTVPPRLERGGRGRVAPAPVLLEQPLADALEPRRPTATNKEPYDSSLAYSASRSSKSSASIGESSVSSSARSTA